MTNGIYNWKIAWVPWSVYTELVNRDIAPMPYDSRQTLSAYSLRKRKSYRNAWSLSGLGRFKDYEVTDVYVREDWECVDCNEWEIDWCNCCRLYYTVNKSRTRYAIIKTTCDDPCNPVVIDCWVRCSCATDKFFPIYGRDSQLLWNVADSSLQNSDGEWFIYTSNDLVPWWPAPWTYIQVIWTKWTAPCWPIRSVVSVEEYNWELKDRNGQVYKRVVQLDQLRPASWDEVLTWAQVIAYNSLDFIPWYIWHNWVQTIVWCSNEFVDDNWNCEDEPNDNAEIWDTLCGLSNCIVSAQQINGLMTYVNSKWTLLYTQAGLNYNYVQNIEILGKDIIDTAAFKWFLVAFGKKWIDAVTWADDLQSTFVSKLDSNNVWLKNKWAWDIFDGWLFFVWTDNRIYWASLTTNGSVYDITMKDITTNIRWYMDEVEDDDEVYLSSDAGNMYIFINKRTTSSNSNLNDTRILKYYKDFEIWLPHEVCGEVIRWFKCWEFFWEGVYNYCWWEWDGIADVFTIDEYGNERFFGRWYEARATAIIYGNNDHWMTSSDRLPLDMFRRHKLSWGTMLLGRWLYTEATRIEVERADKYKWKSIQTIDTDNCWVDDNAKAWNCREVEPSECFLSYLTECDTVNVWCQTVDCEETDSRCSCEWEKKRDTWFCVCKGNARYPISEVEAFNLVFDENFARFHEVSFVSWYQSIKKENQNAYYHQNDVWYFLWFLINTISEVSFGEETEDFSAGCCSNGADCK